MKMVNTSKMKTKRFNMLAVGLNELQSQDRQSNQALRQHHRERCKFCDKLFNNRYAILKHNISHITIPLIRQTTHQCNECLNHFTSVEGLAMHITNKHKNTREPITPVNVNLEQNFNKKIPEILPSIVEKQVLLKCGDEFKKVVSNFNTLETKNGTKQYENGVRDSNQLIKEEPVNPKEEHRSSSDRPSSPTNEEKASIRQRILFEEDIEDDLFKGFSADCQVGLETFYKQMNPEFDKPSVMLSSGEIMDLEPVENGRSDAEITSGLLIAREDTTQLLRYGKAIHYDVLMDPEVCLCRWCGKDFPNRYKLLQHEPKHIIMKMKKKWPWPLCCVCERYISGNYRTLRLHMEKNHPDKVGTNFQIQKCPKCSLRYHNVTKHLKHYHESYRCTECKQGFDTTRLRDGHKCGRGVAVTPTVTAMPSDLCDKISTNEYKTLTDTYKSASYKGSSESVFNNSVKSTVTPRDHQTSSAMTLRENKAGCRKSFESVFTRSVKSTVLSEDAQTSPVTKLCESKSALQETIESTVNPSVKSTVMPQDLQTESVMKLCEMCFSFMKIYMQNRQNYEVIGEQTELGVRQICDKCNNKFFEVKLVKRKHSSKDIPKKLKGSTNLEILKKIRSRLKMIRNRNKY